MCCCWSSEQCRFIVGSRWSWGLIISLSLFLAFEVKVLRSFRISTIVASLVVGTNERPLLSKSTCGLDNCIPERLTMLLVAHW